MVITLESNNTEAIEAITALAKSLNIKFKIVEADKAVVSEAEILRRTKVLKPFKGALKQYSESYQFNKHDWYQQ